MRRTWRPSTRGPRRALRLWGVLGVVAAASVSGVPMAAAPAAAAPASWTLAPYDDLGAWVDHRDWTGSSPTFGLAQVDAIAARGVRTLYLQGARDTGAAPLDPTLQRALIDRAHQRGMAVVTWFLPNHLDPAADRARALALATQLPVDGLALDIESDAVADPALRSARAVQLAAEVDAALAGPVGAIVPAPIGMEINSWYWPGFPWSGLAAHTDAWLPMTYWTYRPAGSEWAEPRRYVSENVRRLRSLAGEPYARVHVLGDAGLSRPVSPAEIDAMWLGASEEGAVGASVYDVSLTRPELWDALARMSFTGLLAGPTVVASAPGRIEELVRGSAGDVRHRSVTADDAGAWVSLGGLATSSPDASASEAGELAVFARGTDRALWYRETTGAGWRGWEPLGGILTSGPGAVSWGPGRIDVFASGTDMQLWHRWRDGSSWKGWEPLSGYLTSDPDVASWGDGRLDVLVRGSDDQLWRRAWNGAVWEDWQPLGGILTSGPGAVSWGPGRIDVFVRGTDMQLWHRWWDGSSWKGWEPLGGYLTSDPDVASWGDGRLDVVVRGSDDQLWRRAWNGAVWEGWHPFGGSLS